MKFLLNMNIPPSLGKKMVEAGHEYRHIAEIDMFRASDLTIIGEARKNNEIIITNDLDYGHLLAFSGESKPSVIIYRVRNNLADYLLERFLEIWNKIKEPLLEGSIVTIEEYAVRIRTLPIERTK